MDSRGTRGSAIENRIGDSSFGESLRAQDATVTALARTSVCAGIIAAVREAIVEVQGYPLSDDIGLCQANQRRVHTKFRAFDTGPGCHRGEPLECVNEFRTAVRIARVVQCIDADHDVARLERLGPRQCQSEKYR